MLYVIFYGYFAFIMTGHLVESKVGEKGGMGSGKVQELWFELGKCNCASRLLVPTQELLLKTVTLRYCQKKELNIQDVNLDLYPKF